MKADDLIQKAKYYDGNLAFKEADSLWSAMNEDPVNLLKERLDHLCFLQDQTCLDLDKKSLKYHAKITGLLEEKGKLLGDFRYYYRAWTYLLGADYLYRMDLPELAIDCYFRALIFQGNFEANDEGKLLFRTLQAILACYVKMNDPDTMKVVIDDFDKKMLSVSSLYKTAYVMIRRSMQGSFSINTESLKQLENETAGQECRDVERLVESSFFDCSERICES